MSRHLLAGVAAALVVALGGVGWALARGPGDYPVHVDLPRTFNLFEGSRVRVLGVEAGTIETIAYPPGTEHVRVTLRVRGDVPLPRDVTASVIQGAMLGERHVELGPAWTGGPRLPAGATIPVDRTTVPSEFDEVLDSLSDFLAELPPDEVGRLVGNAAATLDGHGEQLGRTIDHVAAAVGVLRAEDEAVVQLASRLADLTGTLSTRDDELGALLDDWNTVVGTLAAERDHLDAALGAVADLSEELGDLLAEHGGTLEADVRAVTRLGRTAQRNLAEIDTLLRGQSELYRHAERVFDFEHNWLPLVNHSEDLNRMVADRLANRLAQACDRVGLTGCAEPGFWHEGLPDEVCFAPVATCPGELAERTGIEVPATEDGPTPLDDALRRAVELEPELPAALERHQRRERDEALMVRLGVTS